MKKSIVLALASTALALAGCTTTGTQAGAELPAATIAQHDPLLAGFVDPPSEARPRTWWHWMNGNVTLEGIARDLAWMDRIGIGGFQNFDAGLATAQVVDNRRTYMSPEWREAFRFAAEEAARYDLEMAIAASPGWSETGGPWVAAEDGMKKLVWGETLLRGGERFSAKINRAPEATGPYQAISIEDEGGAFSGLAGRTLPRASGDIAVLAVPIPTTPLPAPRYSLADGTEIDGAVLADGAFADGIALPLAEDLTGSMTVSYPEPVTIRSLRISLPGMVRPFRNSPVRAYLEARQDGDWQIVTEAVLTAVPTTHGFAPVTASEFRLRIAENNEPNPATIGQGAEGAMPIDFFAFDDLSTIEVAEFALDARKRVNRAEEKAGYASVLDYYSIMSADETAVSLGTGDIIDLTDRVAPDGTLDWTPPGSNDWLVLDFGWSLTGSTNHPAAPEATGLEVDKFDPVAVRGYIEHYLGMYRETVGDELFGERGLQAILTDSIEAGLANWTPRMAEEFEARRGYALQPWLPALAGMVIGSEAETERFLFDYRETLEELLTDYHYGTVAEVAHEQGLIVYGEALEDRRPVLGDDLSMRRYADVPMAALWLFPRGGPMRPTFLGDMKGAASTAHVYGQDYVAAESMTSANAPWAYSPRQLKRIIDLEFAYGINRPVIHTSVHVPVEDRKPGLSLMIFGQHFNRNETWAEMAGPWIDYMARSSYMLQQGKYHADIAWFVGEEAPVTAQFATSVPEGLPTRYGFDFVNADMLQDAFRAQDGRLVSQGGTSYRVLHLGGSSHMMTLPTLERIAALAEAGVTVTGRRPTGSPALTDDADAFSALVRRVWSMDNVIDTDNPEAALAQMGVVPDFAFTGGSSDSELLFLHRTSPEADIYFVNNRQDREETVELRLRTTGRVPELWDAVSGTARPLSYRMEDEVTVIPIALAADDAKFVVFRESAGAAQREVAEATVRELGVIGGPWNVAFQEGRGAPDSINIDRLVSLSEHKTAGVRYFSGISSYTTTFEIPSNLASRENLWIDLGSVADVAEVFVNGQRAGITWLAPDRIEISDLVVTGMNELEVRVANRWINRLIGDAQPGAEPLTFTAVPTYSPDAPLRPSGLIGPVRLLYID